MCCGDPSKPRKPGPPTEHPSSAARERRRAQILGKARYRDLESNPRGGAMSTTEDHSHPSGAVQQAPGLWRTDLQRQDLSTPGCEMVQSRVDIGPEAPLVKHTHPGE